MMKLEPDEMEMQVARAVLAEERVQEQQYVIDALVAALEFYATAADDGDWLYGNWKTKLEQDGGARARSALALAQ